MKLEWICLGHALTICVSLIPHEAAGQHDPGFSLPYRANTCRLWRFHGFIHIRIHPRSRAPLFSSSKCSVLDLNIFGLFPFTRLGTDFAGGTVRTFNFLRPSPNTTPEKAHTLTNGKWMDFPPSFTTDHRSFFGKNLHRVHLDTPPIPSQSSVAAVSPRS